MKIKIKSITTDYCETYVSTHRLRPRAAAAVLRTYSTEAVSYDIETAVCTRSV